MEENKVFEPEVVDDAKREAMVADEAASQRFVQMFAQHQRRIHAFISGMVPSQTDVDDIMQETCLVLWRKRAEFDPDRDFTRWACGIAFREVLKFRRSISTRKYVLSEDLLTQIAEDSIGLIHEVETTLFSARGMHEEVEAERLGAYSETLPVLQVVASTCRISRTTRKHSL